MTDVDRAEFWEKLYQTASTGWDLGGPTPVFGHVLAGPDPPLPGKMLVPGCGRGYDALLFARAGFEVTGVDHAFSAVTAARALAEAEGTAATFLQADLFSLPARFTGTFNYVLEYTCFCAIAPTRRAEYVEVMAGLLRPGGEILALFFPVLPPGYGREGPPFAVSEEELQAYFGGRFEITHLAASPHTISPRRGRELLGRLRRR
jgi:SAM-dependent methyltransferase